MACKGKCVTFDYKIPRNSQIPNKKGCRECGYFLQTSNLRCECCNFVFRVNLTRHSHKPTGKPIGRPKKIPIKVKPNPLFNW